MPGPFISGAPLNIQTHTYVHAAQPTQDLKLDPTRMKIVDLHVLLVCFFFVVTCSGSKLICFFLGRICFRSVITCLHPKAMLGFPERHMCLFQNLVGSSFTLLYQSTAPLLSAQLKMAEELAAIHDLLSCVGETPRRRPRKTPPHLQDVVHLAYLRRRRMMDVKWNCLIQELLRMHAELPLRDRLNQELLRMGTEIPLRPPPAEIPLEDAIQQGVAHFLASADVVDVGFSPTSPLSQRSSRMPTTSSSEGWEYLTLSNAAGLPMVHPNLVCYTIYSDDDTQQAVQRAAETLQIPPKAPPQPKAPAEAPPTSPEPNPEPPPVLLPPKAPPAEAVPMSAMLQPKAPPTPPFNLFQPPPKAAKPSEAAPPLKAAPSPEPPPPKAAPAFMGPPPGPPPPKSIPKTRPLKSWKKKAPTVVYCHRCGIATEITQFM